MTYLRHLLFCLLLSPTLVLMACADASAPAASEVSSERQFDAKLIMMPEAQLPEFDKPSDQIPHVELMSRAKVGDRVALKLVFHSMALREDTSCDVTFDIKVTKPDGSPYSGTAHENLLALKGAIPNPNNMYNSDTVLVLEFEPDDPLGKYAIEVVIRDNIGQTDLTLKENITLEQ